jgi:tetratricopeptide (TPR) repeat protein
VLRRGVSCLEGAREEALLFLGLTLVASEKYAEARGCFRKALRIDPKYREARKELLDLENLSAK